MTITSSAQSRAVKAAGLRAANLVVECFQAHFPSAERRVLKGAKDCGDIAGVHDLTVEVKAEKRMALAGWLDEAVREASFAGTPYHVVAHRRVGKGNANDWYATMRLEQFVALYARLVP